MVHSTSSDDTFMAQIFQCKSTNKYRTVFHMPGTNRAVWDTVWSHTGLISPVTISKRDGLWIMQKRSDDPSTINENRLWQTPAQPFSTMQTAYLSRDTLHIYKRTPPLSNSINGKQKHTLRWRMYATSLSSSNHDGKHGC